MSLRLLSFGLERLFPFLSSMPTRCILMWNGLRFYCRNNNYEKKYIHKRLLNLEKRKERERDKKEQRDEKSLLCSFASTPSYSRHCSHHFISFAVHALNFIKPLSQGRYGMITQCFFCRHR